VKMPISNPVEGLVMKIGFNQASVLRITRINRLCPTQKKLGEELEKGGGGGAQRKKRGWDRRALQLEPQKTGQQGENRLGA